MSVAPSISLVAYEARDYRVFVKVPDERGRYLLTDRSVIEVACPECGSVRGEPCKSRQGYGVTTHYRRRSLWKSERPHRRIGASRPDQLEKPRFKLLLPR